LLFLLLAYISVSTCAQLTLFNDSSSHIRFWIIVG
jgi:hypothetical protein